MPARWHTVWCEACGHRDEILGDKTVAYHGRCPRLRTSPKFKTRLPEYKRTPPEEDLNAATHR